jgi:hypothetical protein
MQLVNALDNNKSVFVKKARGLGITEIFLRYMSWLAVFDSTYHNCRFHILMTALRIQLSSYFLISCQLDNQLTKSLIPSGENLYGPSCLGSLSLKHFRNNIPLCFFSICFILLMYFCLSIGKRTWKQPRSKI